MANVPDSDHVEKLKSRIRNYLIDGVIDDKEEFALLLFGREAGLDERATREIVAEVQQDMGLALRNSGTEHLKARIQSFLSDDGVIDKNEMFVLQEAAREIGISDDRLQSLLEQVQSKYSASAQPSSQSGPGAKPGVRGPSLIGRLRAGHKLAWTLLAIPVLLICLACMIRIFSGFTSPPSSPILKAYVQPSKLTYRTILFDKYIVAGNAYMKEQGNKKEHFSKGVVYYVKGEADVSFDLSHFVRGTDGTISYIGENLEGVNEVLPYTINVRIMETEKHRVYEISPQPVTPGEAKSIGAAVGTVAAIGGGYLGIKAGGMIGNTVQVFSAGSLPFSGLIGSVFGGGLGALGGGVTGFVLCNKYLTSLQLTPGMTEGDERKITEEARNLIAAELLFDPAMQKEFTSAFRKYIEEFYNGRGQPVMLNGEFIKIRAAATTQVGV